MPQVRGNFSAEWRGVCRRGHITLDRVNRSHQSIAPPAPIQSTTALLQYCTRLPHLCSLRRKNSNLPRSIHSDTQSDQPCFRRSPHHIHYTPTYLLCCCESCLVSPRPAGIIARANPVELLACGFDALGVSLPQRSENPHNCTRGFRSRCYSCCCFPVGAG